MNNETTIFTVLPFDSTKYVFKQRCRRCLLTHQSNHLMFLCQRQACHGFMGIDLTVRKKTVQEIGVQIGAPVLYNGQKATVCRDYSSGLYDIRLEKYSELWPSGRVYAVYSDELELLEAV